MRTLYAHYAHTMRTLCAHCEGINFNSRAFWVSLVSLFYNKYFRNMLNSRLYRSWPNQIHITVVEGVAEVTSFCLMAESKTWLSGAIIIRLPRWPANLQRIIELQAWRFYCRRSNNLLFQCRCTETRIARWKSHVHCGLPSDMITEKFVNLVFQQRKFSL